MRALEVPALRVERGQKSTLWAREKDFLEHRWSVKGILSDERILPTEDHADEDYAELALPRLDLDMERHRGAFSKCDLVVMKLPARLPWRLGRRDFTSLHFKPPVITFDM